MAKKFNLRKIIEGGYLVMSKKMVFKVPVEIRKQSIEILKVREKTLNYLRENDFKTIEDFIDRQEEVPSEFRGNVYAYLMFGLED